MQVAEGWLTVLWIALFFLTQHCRHWVIQRYMWLSVPSTWVTPSTWRDLAVCSQTCSIQTFWWACDPAGGIKMLWSLAWIWSFSLGLWEYSVILRLCMQFECLWRNLVIGASYPSKFWTIKVKQSADRKPKYNLYRWQRQGWRMWIKYVWSSS